MREPPTSVYRLQLNEDFRIPDATSLLPYLKELGVEGIYCSPYFAAFSPHGYDIVDPNRINPGLATKKEYELFCRKVHEHGLFHIADIVPNHMGIKGDNRWWQDVLQKGKASPFASFFDIDWTKEKIRIPILGSSLDETLKANEISLTEDGKGIQYGGQVFPLDPNSYDPSLSLEELLKRQHYRLIHWLMSAHETSYRRFFNINELIGLRIEDPKVFEAHHKWVFQLLEEKKIDGLRIDHPDGLYDPKTYFDRLRKKHSGLIVVEKILGWEEELPSNWKVEGTVGYEFGNILTGIFAKKEKALSRTYQAFTGVKEPFSEMLYQKKKFYMSTEMAGDIKTLCKRLYTFTSTLAPFADLAEGEILKALYEVLATFPVYRTYIRPKGEVPERDRPYLEEALSLARSKNREIEPRAFDLLEEVLFLTLDTPTLRDWIMRFQQLSAPIMAKGFEDITLYNYNRLLALNEVGSEPSRLGVTSDEFHHFCIDKQKKWPLGLLGVSTHDTKRSMDVRMQLCVLSEMPGEWEKALLRWEKLNRYHKTSIDGELFPDRNAEYALYQTLLGAWPSSPSFERLWVVVQKSLKEARVYTSWRHPDELYEKAVKDFLREILKKGSPFLKAFAPFQKKVAEYGQLNSLSASALHLGAPGIVDIYEGCETNRYTLVDPDNRKPVNFKELEKELHKGTMGPKLFLHQRALHFRSAHRELFLKGRYIPLKVTGPQKEHIVAYLRTFRKEVCLVAGVRFFSSLGEWGSTAIHLPKALGEGRGVFFGEVLGKRKVLNAADLFAEVPFSWVYWS
ncbi:MAG: Maltooligosyl trehalose synthase [Chlamydiae bacterium]|nr:Maltooligosyl trehalose synthase [Chlamydiota bacterium]